MKISIHDYVNSRTIVADVPQYLIDGANAIDSGNAYEIIAYAIFDALGLSESSCEYMIGDDIELVETSLEDLTQDFKADALAALAENN